MSTSAKQSSAGIIKRFLVLSAVFALCMQVVQTVYFMWLQSSTNNNFSAYVWWFISIVILVGIITIVYLSRRNRKLTLDTLFDVAVVSLSIVLLSAGVSWLMMMLPGYTFGINMEKYFAWYIALQQALPLMVLAPVVVVLLRRLRQTKQW